MLCVNEDVGLNPGHDVCFTSVFFFFFLEISGEHCLTYRVCALNDDIGVEFVGPLRETKYIWVNSQLC